MTEKLHYIEFQHVYKTFDHPVLVDVSFHVDIGETLAIIGRSGVGKSVSLGHIMGFLKPDKGRIFVSYQDITDFDEAQMREIRKKVTMVFQSGALFDSLTVGENILFSLELRSDYQMTVLITPHAMEEADALCDALAILHLGKVAAVGKPAQLKDGLGPGATLNDVFAHYSGGTIQEEGNYRDVRQARRTANRLG